MGSDDEITDFMKTRNRTLCKHSKTIGFTHYMVDSRAEACDSCRTEYEGHIFLIDDFESLPPLHSECTCIPLFFETEEEAQEFADEITQTNAEERKKRNIDEG